MRPILIKFNWKSQAQDSVPDTGDAGPAEGYLVDK